MYSLTAYGKMIEEEIRTNAYRSALSRAISDSIVLDIGTGTGIFALLACQLGARRVYAIEPSDAISVAREIAAANGYADKIQFIQALSTQVALPEKVDLVVSDLRGSLPLFNNHHIPAIIDARERLLAPGGLLIPQRDSLWATLVEAPSLYAKYDRPWTENCYGLKMDPARRRTINSCGRGNVTPEQFLVEPQTWASLDYQTIASPDVRGNLSWTATRSGTAHGLIVWFDATLAPGIGYSNSPDSPQLVYGRRFFPLQNPIGLIAGDGIELTIQADLVGEDYIWRWQTEVFAGDNPNRVKAKFQQSTFFAKPFSPEKIRKRDETYVPHLKEAGKIDKLVLTMMEEGKSLSAIARQLAAQFPHRFPSYKEALARVADLSVRYS